MTEPSAAEPEVCLVTGLPSLAATKLVERILAEEPETEIVILVLDRLLPRAAAWMEGLGREDRDRIEVLTGDVAAIDLGLSGAEYLALASRVTRVHNLAAVRFVGADDEEAEATNVGGAREMVELGRAASRLRCIVHHSTAHVSGDRSGLVYEAELDEGQHFHSPIQRTHFLAEKVLRRAMPEVPIAVVRPTMVAGDSVTGEVERLDGPYLLALLVLGIPEGLDVRLPKLGPTPLDVVPVDYVVAAAHAIGLDRGAPGTTFHLTSGEDTTARQLLDLIAQASGRRVSETTAIPRPVVSAIARTPGVQRLLSEPAALLRHLATPARYDTKNARRVLEPLGIVCPPVASYVGMWVKAAQARLEQNRRQ
ncbi:MAG: SDR family oxidoreductase [Polyangiaceae bacterium]